MFAAVMMPSALPLGHASPERLPAMPAFASSPFRPARPSPLSSSPTRAPSSPPAAAFSSSSSSQMCFTQSSPIRYSSQQQNEQPIFGGSFASDASNFNNNNNNNNNNGKSLFRFASRPAKAVARGQQTRDAAQQTRRSLFLRNVRQRADDRSWDRRNFEQELQRMEWFSSEEELRRAREAEAADLYASQDLDDDIEAAMYYDHEDDAHDGMMDDNDACIADLLAMEEEAEIERLLALEAEQAAAAAATTLPAYPPSTMQVVNNNAGLGAGAHQHQLSRQPSYHSFSDDGEYDDIFAEIASAVDNEDTEMSCM